MHCAHVYHWLGEITCHDSLGWYVVVTIYKLLVFGFLALSVFVLGAILLAGVSFGVDLIIKTLEKYHG